ncbi:MAG: DUF6111 family protein [Sneathiella sp.]
MIRGFLFHLIPLLIPFVVYAIYLYFAQKAGSDKTWQGKSIAISTLIGLILMAMSMVVLGLFNGDSIEGTYVPPRFENGKLIGAEIIPSKKD